MGFGDNFVWLLIFISFMSIIYLLSLSWFISRGNEYLKSKASASSQIKHTMGAAFVY